MQFQESHKVELKKTITDTLYKVITAFATHEGGTIYLGVDDEGTVVGVTEPRKVKEDLENKINTKINPRVRFHFNELHIKDRVVLEINVLPGEEAPYFFKGHTYLRNDTSTVPVEGIDLQRLILKKKHLSYDRLEVDHSNLTFKSLKEHFQAVMPYETIEDGILTTLGLLNEQRYNHAAALLSDQGPLSQSYLDVAKFRLDTDAFMERHRWSQQSILDYYTQGLAVFDKYYPPMDVVEGSRRIKKIQVPLEAFRESLVNALIHRDYLFPNGVQIAMFDNRIEVVSPGGLSEEINEALFFKGLVSLARNPILAMVFFRLGYMESFGTGIKRILNAYQPYGVHPNFDLSDHHIRIILPVLSYDYRKLNLTDGILAYLKAFPHASRAQMEQAFDKDKSTIIRHLNDLLKKGLIVLEGQGPNVTYQSVR